MGTFFCIDYRHAPSRLGITASTRYGTAPERNRFKRLVREAFRLSDLPEVEIIVFPRQRAKGATLRDIQDELVRLCSSMNPS